MDQEPARLGIIFFPAYDWAISASHPEREERLLYTHDQLREEGVFDLPGIREYRPEAALPEDVLRAHFCPPGLKRVAADPHFISAGGAITAGRLVATKEAKKSFALVRPPGHHAGLVVHGGRGFCNINNEAIMIEHLRHHFGYRRIAIVDTDCHHGDGSQDIYWHDPDTLFISLHQDGRTLYPGSGFPNEMGGPQAWGSTINIPLPPETGDEGFHLAVKEIVRPILDEWKPELVINSAGQDNHFTDPITNMKLTAQGYAQMSAMINPDIAVLEGGYAIQGALPYTNLAIILSMAGIDWQKVQEPMPSTGRPKTSSGIMGYVRGLVDKIHALRASPQPDKCGSVRRDGWWKREFGVFYDTHAVTQHERDPWPSYLNERRRESLKECPDCPGLLVIETSSEISSYSIHLKLPARACPACRSLATEIESKGKL
jgi:acetoin utilization deacetylase AcuC-like enzyme